MRYFLLLELMVLFFSISTAVFADQQQQQQACKAAGAPKKVVVSGAGGQTGKALLRKLLDTPNEFDATGIVRTQQSKASLVEADGIPENKLIVVDIVQQKDKMQQALRDCEALFICTSATPKPIGEPNPETGRPSFGFPDGGQPRQVDWEGQRNQIDACTDDTHIILCSTMGGTDPNNYLNTIGRDEDGTGGNIVKWKRKAEVYLVESGKPFTIIHPGGLVNENGGERELLVGVDDDKTGSESARNIAREDVAELMLQASRYRAVYQQRSFDVRALPIGEGTPTTDFEHLLDGLDGKNCDYSLGETM